MNYKAEDEEDKKYRKGYGRKEFKKDVADAVEPMLKKGKKARKKRKGKMPPQFANPEQSAPMMKKKKISKSAYAKMSTKELRKLLTDKKGVSQAIKNKWSLQSFMKNWRNST